MIHSLILIFFLLLPLYGESLTLSVGAEGAILVNAKTGAILYEKNAYIPHFPASTTKIATAIYALKLGRDNLDLPMTAGRESIASISPQAKRQSNYRSPPFWMETDGTHIGIKNGEEFRFYDLLNAVLVSSANDASNVIAQNLGGTIPKFMEGLNRYLKDIGCLSTSFNNPHGLHHPEHKTTPYDLALMAREGLKDPIFSRIVSSKKYTCPQTNLEYQRTFIQTNSLLKNGPHYYDKAIGVKTGTTQAAGKNLVAAAKDGDRVLIAVAMGYRGARSELYQDVVKMFETAFQEQKMRRTLLKSGPQTLTKKISGAQGTLKTYLKEGLYFDYFPAEEVPVKASIIWEVSTLPVRAEDQVATIQIVSENGVVLQETPLYALDELKPTFWYRIAHLFPKTAKGRKILYICGMCIVFCFIWMMRPKRRLV